MKKNVRDITIVVQTVRLQYFDKILKNVCKY